MLTLRNDFHHTETRMDETKPLTKRRVRDIRRRLCSDACVCGNWLGCRGPQDPGVAELVDEAVEVMLTT